MIIAYHAIFTTYGTWLPNDPRGSFSAEVYKQALRDLGAAHYGRRADQPAPKVLRHFWTQARPKLNGPPYFIDDATRPIVARAFAMTVNRLHLVVRACAIMNDHVHILLDRGAYRLEYVVGKLKGEATRLLKLARTPWARGQWKVFIEDHRTTAIVAEYINANPVRAGMAAQHWDLVTPLPPSF